MDEFGLLYREIFTENNLEDYISNDMVGKFAALTAALIRRNNVVNLTAITDPAEIIAKHYADSVSIARYIGVGETVIDIGCGAGFPSLPLAIVRPDLVIAAVDSTAKKLAFVSEMKELLSLQNLTVVNARAEDLGTDKKHRERYDTAVSRAVAPLGVLCEYCLPLVKVGGKLLAMKGANVLTEIDSAMTALVKLGGKMAENVPINLQMRGETQKHFAVIIQKNSATPIIYPRKNAQITNNPL
jgi:16S rRNA (guanine527-N7)-methyltransferase